MHPLDAVVAFVLHMGKDICDSSVFSSCSSNGGFHAIEARKAHRTSGPNGLSRDVFRIVGPCLLRSWFALCLHSWELAIKTTLWSPVQFRKVYLNPVFRIRMGSGFNQVRGSESGSRRVKMNYKIGKTVSFMV
jgi:hypothetical protein